MNQNFVGALRDTVGSGLTAKMACNQWKENGSTKSSCTVRVFEITSDHQIIVIKFN